MFKNNYDLYHGGLYDTHNFGRVSQECSYNLAPLNKNIQNGKKKKNIDARV